MVAAGSAASLVSARGVARAEDVRSRQAFETSAGEISSSMRVAIQHEEDLVVNAGAFIAANPDITTGELHGWIDSVRAAERYPELLGVGAMTFVRHDALGAFAEQLQADPSSPLGPSGELTVTPVGSRPFYCLIQATVTLRPAAVANPYGVDYCAAGVGPPVLAARDSGMASNFAVPSPNGVLWVVQAPLYRGGRVPDSVDARRAEYLGALGASLAPGVLFDSVLHADPDATITLRYEGAAGSAVFSNRPVPPDAESVRDDYGNGWSTTVSRAAVGSGLASSPSALGLASSGIVVSVLLGSLVHALVTSRRRALRLVARRTDELRHQALHDALTGLPNRVLVLDRVEQLLARCRRHGTVGAALYLDLDGFKNVNDTLGHDAGDQLLRAVAERLTTGLREVDTIGRMGGDEFVVLVEDGSSWMAPELVAQRVLEIMRHPFEFDRSGRSIAVTVSVGVSTALDGARGDLVREADIALYRAKAAGKNCYQLFQPSMEAALEHNKQIDFDLRSALETSQFRLLYQPIYALSDLTIIGVEALIRWEHPTRGLLQPDEFIPRLEASGHIVEVGRWVLIEACRQVALWRARDIDLTVSVNVSALQLDRDSIVDHVAEALTSAGLDPSRLIVEITETALMKDTDLTARRLHALKGLGIQLAIDDFGTGYSSLAYLQRFPVDCLKIDRTFIDAITTSPGSKALLRTLVQLGKDLGMQILAEGVETASQLEHLRGVAVDQAQGFLLARPLSADALEEQLLAPHMPDVTYRTLASAREVGDVTGSLTSMRRASP